MQIITYRLYFIYTSRKREEGPRVGIYTFEGNRNKILNYTLLTLGAKINRELTSDTIN